VIRRPGRRPGRARPAGDGGADDLRNLRESQGFFAAIRPMLSKKGLDEREEPLSLGDLPLTMPSSVTPHNVFGSIP